MDRRSSKARLSHSGSEKKKLTPEEQEEMLNVERKRVMEVGKTVIKCKNKKNLNLLRACLIGDDKKVVSLISKALRSKEKKGKGIDINCCDIERGETPLHWACAAGHNSTVDYLLRKDANADAQNKSGHTPLHKAAYYDYHDIIRTLVSHNADPDVRDANGISALWVALNRNNPDSASALLEARADFTLPGPMGAVALVEAAQRGFHKACLLILKRNGDVNSRNEAGNTALHVAALEGHTAVIATVMGFRPDVTIKNRSGKTPADLAELAGNLDVAKIVRKEHKFTAEQESTHTRNVNKAKPDTAAGSVQGEQKKTGPMTIAGNLLVQKGKNEWKEAWIEIRDGILYHYAKQFGKQLAYVNLYDCQQSEDKESKLPCCFRLNTLQNRKKPITLRAETVDMMQEWMDVIFRNSVPASSLQSVTKSVSTPEADQEYRGQIELAAFSGNTWSNVADRIEERIRSPKVIEGEWIALEERELGRPDELFSDAYLPCNEAKNRYTNIVPYNSTRVKLATTDSSPPGGDYINANYIKASDKLYIACQAPLPFVFEDFYRMIWEQNCRIIVMITKLEEAGKLKAHRYLPELGTPLQFGDIIVELSSSTPHKCKLGNSEEKEHYVINKLNVWRESEFREILHYQFVAWPDHGCPETPDHYLEMLEIVDKAEEDVKKEMDASHEKLGPLVIHCSAGIGRTGTWIVINSLINDLQKQRFQSDPASGSESYALNLMSLVDSLRGQRPGLLTHVDQYEFCMRGIQAYINATAPRRRQTISHGDHDLPTLLPPMMDEGLPPPPDFDLDAESMLPPPPPPPENALSPEFQIPLSLPDALGLPPPPSIDIPPPSLDLNLPPVVPNPTPKSEQTPPPSPDLGVPPPPSPDLRAPPPPDFEVAAPKPVSNRSISELPPPPFEDLGVKEVPPRSTSLGASDFPPPPPDFGNDDEEETPKVPASPSKPLPSDFPAPPERGRQTRASFMDLPSRKGGGTISVKPISRAPAFQRTSSAPNITRRKPKQAASPDVPPRF